MVVRFYSSTAAETTLTGTVNNVATTISVGSVTGFPVSFPYTLALDYESAGEELVDVTAAAGTSLTVVRAVDGTSGTSHSAGARVRHVSSGRDHRDSRNHENATTGVHGIAGALVGTTDTQSLSNKTLVNATGTLNRIDINSEGVSGWQTTINGDIDFNTNLTVWKRGPGEAHEVAGIANNGLVFVRNQNVAADSVFNTFRFRAVKDDGSTNIFYVTSGGEVRAIQDVGQNGFTSVPRVDNSTNRAFGVRNAADSANLFIVFQDGRVDINGSNPAVSQLDVLAAPGQSTDIMRVQDSASATQVAVQASGRLLANKAATIAQPGVLSGAVLQVGGSNVGYTGNLTQWVSPANVIVGSVNQAGNASFTPTETTTGVSPSSGWTVAAQVMRRTAGVTYANVSLTRSGAAINVPASGNITDLQIATVPAAWSPPENTYVHAGTGLGSGSVRLNADNTVDLTDWTPSTSIDPGETLRFAWTFVE